MAGTVAEMTPTDLREMLGELIEEKLAELVSDPDRGLELKESLYRRLEVQKVRTAAGERGRDLEEVVQELDLG